MVRAGIAVFAFVLLDGLFAGCGTGPVPEGSEDAGVKVQRQTPAPSNPDRVLFVGNSLTYYGNVPAIFSALAEASGKPVTSDMIVVGGAELTERVADGTVARALDERRYTALVLQERGGALIGSFG